MVMVADCIACQYGQHDGHIDVPGPVPEGVMGGWQCNCAGDCAERNGPRIERENAAIIEVVQSNDELAEAAETRWPEPEGTK